MKLRIKGDSVRLRLTQTEVAALARNGRVEDRVRFGSGASLRYCISADDRLDALGASFDGATIEVRVPAAALRQWCNNDDVTLSGVQRQASVELSVVVEKDFACLKPREAEDESDNFPHPLAGSGKAIC